MSSGPLVVLKISRSHIEQAPILIAQRQVNSCAHLVATASDAGANSVQCRLYLIFAQIWMSLNDFVAVPLAKWTSHSSGRELRSASQGMREIQ